MNGGTLLVHAADAFGTGRFYFQRGTLEGNLTPLVFYNPVTLGTAGITVTFGSISPLTFYGAITLVQGLAGIEVDNIETVFAGPITENIAGAKLIKTGLGRLDLVTSNNYSGDNSLNSGTLTSDNNHALA